MAWRWGTFARCSSRAAHGCFQGVATASLSTHHSRRPGTVSSLDILLETRRSLEGNLQRKIKYSGVSKRGFKTPLDQLRALRRTRHSKLQTPDASAVGS